MKDKQELLRDLIELTNLNETLKATADTIHEQVDGILFTQTEANRIVNVITREDHIQEFCDEIINLLDNLYTEEQLRVLCNIYSENPWIIKTMPQMFSESNKLSQRLMQKWMGE